MRHYHPFRIAALACLLALAAIRPSRAADKPAAPGGEDFHTAVTEPFTVDWTSPPDSLAGVSFLLTAPAGKDGFVRIVDGHLAQGSGQRLRIWGVNATAKGCLPAKEDAPRVAAHLARCGINCVRFHFLDSPAPRGLIEAGRDDTQSLDAAELDRLDFFIARLKERGIYADLNLNVAHVYKKGDGVRDCELLGFAKALTYFDPRLIELQKLYARQLLTHRNPYTQNEYRVEPAVALVELVNENSIVESWINGRLLGQNQRKNPGTWTDIPASYEQALTTLYNHWLGEHLDAAAMSRLRAAAGTPQGQIARLTPKKFTQADKERFHVEAAFYMDLEQRYFRDMQRYLRQELGVKPLLLATADHNHSRSGYPLLASTSQLDVIDGHVYWQHPTYVADPASGRHTGFWIPNSPMVNDPLHSSVVELSRTALAGKPYLVSEVNHPFPHEYACEGIPILAAYAALHDWDGIFWYTLAHDDVAAAGTRAMGHFDLAPDPVKMTQIAAAALIFLRSDVRPATQVASRSYSAGQVIESLRLPNSEKPYFTPGFPLSLPLLHATRITSLAGSQTTTWEQAASGSISSDTGELTWQGAADKHGLVRIDTARSQALVGYCRANHAETRNLGTQIENPFCAVTLSALDNHPIARSARLLLTAAARVGNSGMRWDAGRHSLDFWGKPPTCIETVRGSVMLRGLERATAVTAQPLDGVGRPVGSAIRGEPGASGWNVAIGATTTTWYLITVTRPAGE